MTHVSERKMMRRWCVGTLIAVVCFLLVAMAMATPSLNASSGQDWYIAPDGSEDGDGSIENPWDFATGIVNTPQQVAPGDTIWVREGQYRADHWYTNDSDLSGTADAPVIIRAYPGERASIVCDSDGKQGGVEAVLEFGPRINHVWLWGMEVFCDVDDRATSVEKPYTAFDLDIYSGLAVPNGNTGIKYINNIVHNTAGGIGSSKNSSDTEIHGNLIYNIGYDAQEGAGRGAGHCSYVQNAADNPMLVDANICWGTFGLNYQVRSGAGASAGVTFENNIGINSGSLSAENREWAISFDGGEGIVIENNAFYRAESLSTTRNNYVNLPFLDFDRFSNNIFGGQYNGITIWKPDGAEGSVTDNFFYVRSQQVRVSEDTSDLRRIDGEWDRNTYITEDGGEPFNNGSGWMSFSEWQQRTGFDANSTHTTVSPSETVVRVYPNRYEEGRANVAVFNWGNRSSVEVDFSAFMEEGTAYEIRDVYDFWGEPTASGTYAGGSVEIPIYAVDPPAAKGDASTASGTQTRRDPGTGTEFKAFVIVPITGDTPPPSPQPTTQPPGDPTATSTPVPQPTDPPSPQPTTPIGGSEPSCPQENEPGPWQVEQIGDTAEAVVSVDGETVIICGSGTGFGPERDDLVYVYQSADGDAALTVRVDTLSSGSGDAQMGLLLRQGDDRAAPMTALTLQEDAEQALMEVRPCSPADDGYPWCSQVWEMAGIAASAPHWLRLEKRGTTVTAYATDAQAPEPADWVALRQYNLSDGGADVRLGMYVTSGGDALAQSVLTNVQMSNEGVAPPPEPTTQPPEPTTQPPEQTCTGETTAGSWQVADIGGQREHTVIANGGTLFLCAGGEVLEGEDDRFTYVYEDISAGGENRFAVLTARVTNLAGHAGIVVRQGSVVESSRSFAALTAREGRSTLFQKRAGSGMDIWGLASKDVSAPVWLQVRVDGTQVSGFISRGEQPDNWEPVWATDLPPSVPTMQIGFYVAAGGAGGAQTTLTDVTLTQSAAEGTPRLHAAAEVVPQMAGSAFSIPVPIAVCGLYTVWQESTDRGPRYTAPGWHGNVIVGTGEADTLTGSEAEDLIVALGGNDQVDAGGGSDLVCGGDGDDRVQGGDGDDRVYGGRGNDVVHGSRGNDFLVGGGGYDQVQGGDGDDTVTDRLTHEDDTVQGVEHIFPRQHRQVEELFLPLIAR